MSIKILKAIIVITIFIIIFNVLAIIKIQGQVMPIEIMAGSRNIWYQQNISKGIDGSKFGFSHTSTLHAYYDDQNPTELMSQSYMNYSITKSIKVSAGTFYASAPGFRPSINIEFSKKFKNLLIVLVPRVDIWHKPTYDTMFLIEYSPVINDCLKLFFRFQTMANFSAQQHNRSYQNLRMGLSYKKIQFGLAINMDAYGKTVRYYPNVGVFIRGSLF